MYRGVISGVIRSVPSGYITLQGSILELILASEKDDSVRSSHVKGNAQYSENMVETMLTTIPSFVSSVAVTSMKRFVVSKVILLCSELMIGGIERTRSAESYMIGYTGESLII